MFHCKEKQKEKFKKSVVYQQDPSNKVLVGCSKQTKTISLILANSTVPVLGPINPVTIHNPRITNGSEILVEENQHLFLGHFWESINQINKTHQVKQITLTQKLLFTSFFLFLAK